MRNLKTLPEVVDDIAQTADWYNEHGYPGLGDRFIQVFVFIHSTYIGIWRNLSSRFFEFQKDASSAFSLFSLLSLS